MPSPKLNPPPRFRLAMLPTPIELFGLSPVPDSGIDIFIKRDDLTGSELTGNKIRKLEFILYDAISKGHDTLITCGGIGSNHCRATAALAARAGLKCELILKGEKPSIPDGNLLLDILYGARLNFISERKYESNIHTILSDRADRLAAKGRKPYIIPEGASNPLGVWGYFLAGIEIKRQLDKASIKADTIVCAVGSGGTYAGLYLASLYLNWPIRLIGFAVNRDCLYFTKRIIDLADAFVDRYDLRLKPSISDIEIDDAYIGPGYAKIGGREASFIKGVARNDGIVLDPAYTAKAMFGLFDYMIKGKIEPKAKVVFIHTGGLPSVFPYRKYFYK